jgi:hypothetical protein
MRDEIWAGLKNAIERGATLDQAIESFISAGYNPVEVREAANSLGFGAVGMLNPNTTEQAKKTNESENELPNLPQVSIAQPPKELTTAQLQDTAGQPPQKMLYVPTEQKYERPPAEQVQQPQQNLQSMQNVLQLQKTQVGYIPHEGADSTRKKKIIILLVFLLILTGTLIAVVLFWKDIAALIKNFYG